jgi:hypothetical protein
MRATDPIVAASLRAFYGAILVGSAAFLAIWATSDDTKVIVVGTATPVVGYLMARGGLEGAYDQARKPNQNVPPATLVDDERPGV